MTKEKIIFEVCNWYSKGYLPEQVPSKCVLKAMDEWGKMILKYISDNQQDFSTTQPMSEKEVNEYYNEILSEINSNQ